MAADKRALPLIASLVAFAGFGWLSTIGCFAQEHEPPVDVVRLLQADPKTACARVSDPVTSDTVKIHDLFERAARIPAGRDAVELLARNGNYVCFEHDSTAVGTAQTNIGTAWGKIFNNTFHTHNELDWRATKSAIDEMRIRLDQGDELSQFYRPSDFYIVFYDWSEDLQDVPNLVHETTHIKQLSRNPGLVRAVALREDMAAVIRFAEGDAMVWEVTAGIQINKMIENSFALNALRPSAWRAYLSSAAPNGYVSQANQRQMFDDWSSLRAPNYYRWVVCEGVMFAPDRSSRDHAVPSQTLIDVAQGWQGDTSYVAGMTEERVAELLQPWSATVSNRAIFQRYLSERPTILPCHPTNFPPDVDKPPVAYDSVR